jgi:excisionase family DNA binding protein
VTDEPTPRRFLTIEQVAEELNVKASLVRGLIKTGELRGIQVGGRGVWRIGANDLEDYIAEAYRRTAERIAAGEFKDDGESEPESLLQKPSAIWLDQSSKTAMKMATVGGCEPFGQPNEGPRDGLSKEPVPQPVPGTACFGSNTLQRKTGQAACPGLSLPGVPPMASDV